MLGTAAEAAVPLPRQVLDLSAAQIFVDESETWIKSPLCSTPKRCFWNEFKALAPLLQSCPFPAGPGQQQEVPGHSSGILAGAVG